MTISFTRKTPRSSLVRRLVRARNDPGKERIRMWLTDLDDAELRSGLGLMPEDIADLRAVSHPVQTRQAA
jgi:hypothetical protein